MGAESAMIGGAVAAFLFIYTMNKLDDKHFLLKIILLFFSAISCLIIGQGVVADQYNCSWNVMNSTSSGSTTTYEYEYQCDDTAVGANSGLYVLMLWYFRILGLYSGIYFIYMVFLWFKGIAEIRGKGGFKRRGL